MSDPIVAWRTEHEYFRRLLALLHGQLDVFQRGERPDYELMLDVIGYLREYGDAFHHPREDVAFARLKQEHRVIERAGERLAALLNQALDGAMVARVEIEVAAATYLVATTSPRRTRRCWSSPSAP